VLVAGIADVARADERVDGRTARGGQVGLRGDGGGDEGERGEREEDYEVEGRHIVEILASELFFSSYVRLD